MQTRQAVRWSKSQGEDFRQDRNLQVQFHHHAVRSADDPVPVLLQHPENRGQVRAAGDGSDDIPVVIKNRQPGSHAIRNPGDIIRIDLVAAEPVDHIPAGSAGIHHADKGRPEFHVGNIFRHIPADAAVGLHHTPHIPAAGNIAGKGIALDIHKNGTEDDHAHPFHTNDPPNSFVFVFRILSAAYSL